jgi:hypothetical protein
MASPNNKNIPKNQNNKPVNNVKTKASSNNNLSNNSSEPSTKINAPSLKNTSKQSIAINNTPVASNASTSLQTAKEEAGLYEVASDNYIILLAITSAIIIIIIIYFFSQTFRVDRAIKQMRTYREYQDIKSIDYGKYGSTRLGDYYILSAYNAAHVGYQMYDYTNEKLVKAALQSGARYLEFNVFNSEFGQNAYPVASMGYKKGEWKMMVNDTPLETIFQVIKDNAFIIYDGENGVDNPDDPIFISLVLNTNSNLDCLNLTAYLITKYFGDRLLPNQYSFQHNDEIADIKLSQVMGKVVIFASDGFQGSGMEEVVNYSWDNTDNNPKHAMRRYLYSDLTKPGFNKQELIDFNRTGFTIVVPHQEGDFLNTNYSPIVSEELGCQFIAMELQYIDTNMDYYITRFKSNSLVMKNDDLLKGKTNITRPITTSYQATKSTRAATTIPATTRPNF